MMYPPAATIITTPPTISFLTSEVNPSGASITTPSITPPAGMPLLVVQAQRRHNVISSLAQATVSNSGTSLGWSIVSDVSELNQLPSAIRVTIFGALAPTPARAFTVGINAANAVFQHVVVLGTTDASTDYSNRDFDADANGDLSFVLPVGLSANSQSLVASAVCLANGPIDPPPFFNPGSFTELYNATRANGLPAPDGGTDPIACFVGYKPGATTTGGTSVGFSTCGIFLEIKHA
jgi:hypothetical protein